MDIPATSDNIPGTLVLRDASGNLSAGMVAADVTGDLVGNVTGAVTGNVTGDLTGNSATATALQTSRTIGLTGDVTGSASFDGTADASITASIGSGVIVNADIKSDAAIAGSKLADGAITNAKVDAAAAIAGTKIAPDFGAQDVIVGSSGQVVPNTGSNDGVTLQQSGYAAISRDNLICLFLRRRSGDGDIADFRRDTTKVGSISVTTTATTYNESSDYRLKQNIEPMTGGLEKLAHLKPSTYEFKSEPNVKVDGFIAHEVAEVVPRAVTGEKDGEEMQGLDMSKLVPVLVAAVQELSAKVAALESAQ